MVIRRTSAPNTRQGVRDTSTFNVTVSSGVVLVLEILGIDRSHGEIWNWTHKLSEAQSDPPTTQPLRVVVDENQIEVDAEKKRLYAAIDTESKLLLEIDVFGRPQNALSVLVCERDAGRLVNAAGTVPRRRSCIGLPRYTISMRQSFSSMLVAI